MKDAMNPAARQARVASGKWFLVLLLSALAGCALPSPPAPPVVYDFGPGPLTAAAGAAPSMPTLVLDVIEANAALDSTALLYRLAYVDSQQLRPYALARWSMTPTQLLRQRLRLHLGQRRTLLNPGESMTAGAPWLLQLELEEFSQLFESTDRSSGLLRLRATLSQPGAKGGKWLAQRSLIVQRQALTADAAGGVRALTATVDAAAQELEQWLQDMTPAASAPGPN